MNDVEFPKLERPTVFIATPGDMQYIRHAIHAELDVLRSSLGQKEQFDIYDWVDDKSKSGFDQWSQAQSQIPLPSDPYCIGVICVFGERIGTPLPDDFPLESLGRYSTLTTRGNHGIKSNWNDQYAFEGFFSLTGTVFEFIAALNSKELNQKVVPILLLFVGDETINDPEIDLLDANWGGRRLMKISESKYKKSELRRWETNVYLPQVAQIRNFYHFISELGIVPKIIPNEQAAKVEINAFLSTILKIETDSQNSPNPFKGLQSYNLEDSMVLFGREQECIEGISEIKSNFQNLNKANALAILGTSGSGKSSYMKGGLLASLVHSKYEGDFTTIILSPDSFENSEKIASKDGLDNCLRIVLHNLFEAIQITENEKDHLLLLSRMKKENQAQESARLISDLIQDKDNDLKLIIALDQFEEILDLWLEEDTQDVWKSLMEFLVNCSKKKNICIVYTLQINRVDLISNDLLLGEFFLNGALQVIGFPRQYIKKIIRQPFAIEKIELETKLVNELEHKILSLYERAVPEEQGSLLPLVSVCLQRLYKAIERGAIELEKIGEEENSGSMKWRLPLINCGEYILFEHSIKELANETLKEVKSTLGDQWTDDVIEELLRGLIRINEGDNSLLSLKTLKTPSDKSKKELIHALMENRLLVKPREGYCKLVHEMVIHNWPVASEWLEKEKLYLQQASALLTDAYEWRSIDYSQDFIETSGLREADRSASVLDKFYFGVFDNEKELDEDDLLLKRYCLALLKSHNTPLREIKSSKDKISHIHLLARYGALDVMKSYIKHHPESINHQTDTGKSPLYYAAFSGRIGIINFLCENKADLLLSYKGGWQPIHVAAFNGHLEVVKSLLNYGADINSLNDYDQTVLHQAVRKGHLALVNYILKLDTSSLLMCDNNSDAILLYAVYSDKLNIVNRCLKVSTIKEYYSNGFADRCLHAAVRRGNYNIVKVLLKSGIDPNFTSDLVNNSNALHIAVELENYRIVKLLLSVKIDLEVERRDGLTPLGISLLTRFNLKISRLLLKHGSDVNHIHSTGDSIFHLLFKRRSISVNNYEVIENTNKVVDFLLKSNIDVNISDVQGCTALHYAVLTKKTKIIQLLIKKGIDILVVNKGGHTALHLACILGDIDIVKILLNNGCKFEAVSNNKETSLALAIKYNHDQLVSFIMELTPKNIDKEIIQNNLLFMASKLGADKVVVYFLGKISILPNIKHVIEAIKPTIKNRQYDLALVILKRLLLILDNQKIKLGKDVNLLLEYKKSIKTELETMFKLLASNFEKERLIEKLPYESKNNVYLRLCILCEYFDLEEIILPSSSVLLQN